MGKDELAALIVEITQDLRCIEAFRGESALGSIILNYEENLDSLVNGKNLTDLAGGGLRVRTLRFTVTMKIQF
jgi:hypothetical protein